MKRLALLILVVFTSLFIQAQENPVSNGTLTTCGGFFVDTGLSAGDYGNNENFTMTICAEAPETIVNLYFNLFQLGNGDSMTIYDGTDTSAPLIGTFEGTDLQTTDVTSTNDDGCLTIVWVTDDSDVGNFTAETTCGLPCERPVVAVDVASDNPWRICVDEEISLDASPTTFADGTALDTFTWDFGDNTTNSTDWPIVSHSFSQPGAYLIQLFVTDDNECSNANLIDVLVEVSTTPYFQGTTEDLLLCLGQELELEGVVTPIEWSASPSSNFGGALFIPDDQTQCFGSEIIVGGFTAGQEVTQVSDIVDFFINFEHSFMGDLTITFLCPNGQSVIAHAQGGGGTFLGEPIDDDGMPDAEGVGYDYWWAPDATNGTWADEGGGTLPSDTYQTVGDWEDLIGCPLNGLWSIEICDSWGSDNGFIFDWSVTFDPSLYPEDLSFTPSIGAECDSTFWTGDGPLDLLNDCSSVASSINEAGDYVYTYHAVDNHGCEYTQEVNVEVSEITAFAGDNYTICPEQSSSLNGVVEFSGSALNDMVVEWTPDLNLANSGLLNTTISEVTETVDYTLTVYPNGLEECASVDEITVTPIDGPVAEISTTPWCPDESTILSAVNVNLLDSVNWLQVGTSEIISNSDTVTVNVGGDYVLLAYGCGLEDQASVFVDQISCYVIAPNVFSPNGDSNGMNEAFHIIGLEGRGAVHLQVFNRWGSLVYEDTSYNNDWSPSEKEATEGVYFYTVRFPDGEELSGTLTLVR